MNLEGDKRLNLQLRLDFSSAPTGEARQAGREDIESSSAVSEPERPANTRRIMEEVCERANLKEALRQVRSNKGSAGVDGMTVDQLGDYLKQHWPAIRDQLLNGTYEPKPVRRVEIPKPDGGGMRKLGIPTVLDRFIQQAVMQVLQKRWNPTFSHHSYGFRPHRSAHQAVAQAQQYLAQGYGWVIDLDLEKFFDRVNHDKLMGQIAKRVEDKRLLKLIRAFLNAGVMENGLVSPSVEGTPQGGPLSPLLSNLLLDELDRELERRGHRFVRYADDCNIYVGRVGSVYAGLAQLFRLLRNTPSVDRSHSLGPVATAGCSLAPVENTTAPPGGTGRKRGLDMGCQEHGRQRPRSLVSRPQSSPLHRALKCALQIARSPIPVPSVLAPLLEPPCTDPYARWCGRGGAARLHPIPINH